MVVNKMASRSDRIVGTSKAPASLLVALSDSIGLLANLRKLFIASTPMHTKYDFSQVAIATGFSNLPFSKDS